MVLTLVRCNTKTKNAPKFPEFEIGVVADCQYCNCEPSGARYYRKSTERLHKAINILNQGSLDYAIHLGDFIDRNFESFDSVVPIWNSLKSDKYHVLGNHDFSVADSLKPLIFKKMGVQNRYYSIVKNAWRFIVLDGNDLSVHGALSPDKKKQTDSLFQLLSTKNKSNLEIWNGGLSNEQLKWVESELMLATKNKERVGFYCHFPVVGKTDHHNLWNYDQLLSIIDQYQCVKFYFNGHNHAGSYVQRDGVHYLNFKGMVNTDDSTSFATVAFRKDSLIVKGFGRELSRNLKIR
jgi:predicted phosphodiesterase